MNLQENGKVYPYKIPFHAPVKFIALVPNYEISTRKSRKVLPQRINIRDVAFQSSRMALLTALFSKKRWGLGDKQIFRQAIQDKLHQPFRMKLP